MDWITDAVAIGTREEALDVASLSAVGMRSILCLDGALSPAVVAGYLMGSLALDPNQARALVASKRDISISAALIPFLFML